MRHNIYFFPQCQKIVKMKLMPYCTLLPNFLQGEKKRFGASCLNWQTKPTLLSSVDVNCVSCRYGETHPMFYIGSLEAASQEAFYGKARDVSKRSGSSRRTVTKSFLILPFLIYALFVRCETLMSPLLAHPSALMSLQLGPCFFKQFSLLKTTQEASAADWAGYYSLWLLWEILCSSYLVLRYWAAGNLVMKFTVALKLVDIWPFSLFFPVYSIIESLLAQRGVWILLGCKGQTSVWQHSLYWEPFCLICNGTTFTTI